MKGNVFILNQSQKRGFHIKIGQVLIINLDLFLFFRFNCIKK